MVQTRRETAVKAARRDIDVRDARIDVGINMRFVLNSDAGVDLDAFINKNPLQNARIFYVIRAKQDVSTSVYKFGFAQLPTARLNSYVHTYGHGDAVKIHILIRTRYDSFVERERSLMYRFEKHCKNYLKSEISATNRGDERVKGSLNLIRAALGVSQGDTETRTLVDRNRSRRLRALSGLPALLVGRGSDV